MVVDDDQVTPRRLLSLGVLGRAGMAGSGTGNRGSAGHPIRSAGLNQQPAERSAAHKSQKGGGETHAECRILDVGHQRPPRGPSRQAQVWLRGTWGAQLQEQHGQGQRGADDGVHHPLGLLSQGHGSICWRVWLVLKRHFLVAVEANRRAGRVRFGGPQTAARRAVGFEEQGAWQIRTSPHPG